MRHKYKSILILEILYLIVILFAKNHFAVFLCNTENNENDKSVDVSIKNETILPLTDDAGQEYIDKIYFVGDSTTYHFFKCGIEKSHILVPQSYTLKLTSDINKILVGNNNLTIAQAIKDADCEIVIITLGANGADNFTEAKYKTYYKKLIYDIKKESPKTKIIIQSVFPVTEEYSNQHQGITNEGIDRINEWAKELACEVEVKYLDTQSILKNENGAQIEAYSEQDGVHMNSKAYNAIIYYIRTHAIK